MQKENEVFFVTQKGILGVTSTSAAHLCNVAKEVIAELRAEIEPLSFVTETVSSIGSLEHTPIKQGVALVSVGDKIETNLDQIADITALVSFFREGIKAKESEIKKLKSIGSLEEMCIQIGIQIPIAPMPPKATEPVSLDFALGKLSLSERVDYYVAEGEAVSYGKSVSPSSHENFYYSRKKLLEAVKNPSRVEGEDNSLVIYRLSPESTVAEVGLKFAKLQSMHREKEARLNGLKAKLDAIVTEENLRIIAENKNKLSEFAAERADYNEEVTKIQNAFAAYQTSAINELSKLKIVVPERLHKTFAFLSDLGKNCE